MRAFSDGTVTNEVPIGGARAIDGISNLLVSNVYLLVSLFFTGEFRWMRREWRSNITPTMTYRNLADQANVMTIQLLLALKT